MQVSVYAREVSPNSPPLNHGLRLPRDFQRMTKLLFLVQVCRYVVIWIREAE